MSNKVHVKTGDTVVVLSGTEKGKKGKKQKPLYQPLYLAIHHVNHFLPSYFLPSKANSLHSLFRQIVNELQAAVTQSTIANALKLQGCLHGLVA